MQGVSLKWVGLLLGAAGIFGCISDRPGAGADPDDQQTAAAVFDGSSMPGIDGTTSRSLDGGRGSEQVDGGGVSDSGLAAADGSMLSEELDAGQNQLDAEPGRGNRCIEACSDAVDCLRGDCSASPFGRYAACVDACSNGEVAVEELEGKSCVELKSWVCAGPYAGECGCRLVGCEDSCENVLRCLEPICNQQVITLEACIEFCEQGEDGFNGLGLNSVACDDVQSGLCPQLGDVCAGCPQRDPEVFNLGAACTRDGECQAGTLRPYCIPALDPGGAGETGWVDGYCTGVECRMGECGPEGVCLGVNEQGQTACFLRCELDMQDCRMGYGCFDIGFGDIAVCGPF